MTAFADFYTRNIYRILVGTVGRFFGWFPFSVSELLLYALIISIFYWIYKTVRLRKPLYLIKRVVITAVVLGLLFVFNCGINYRASAFSSYTDFKPTEVSEEKLIEVCTYLKDKINENSGLYVYKDGNQDKWEKEARKSMMALGEEYETLSGFYPEPKGLLVSYILSVQQLCGVYSPFTIEANYNRDMPNYNVPHSMCHELSHLKGFMHEDEANFLGFLACIESDEAAFRYSGYMMGFVYCGNELAARNRAVYSEIYGELSEQAIADMKQNNEFWDKYEGKAAEVQEKVNDTYLKVNGQKEGVKTYGRCVDLILGWYEKKER